MQRGWGGGVVVVERGGGLEECGGKIAKIIKERIKVVDMLLNWKERKKSRKG